MSVLNKVTLEMSIELENPIYGENSSAIIGCTVNGHTITLTGDNRWIDDEGNFYYDGELLDHFFDMSVCADCGHLMYNDNCYATEDGIVCYDCYTTDYRECVVCGDIIYADDAYYTDDDAYCASCYNDRYTSCDICSGSISRGIAIRVWRTPFEQINMCQDCLSDNSVYVQCPHCHDYSNINNVENCPNCGTNLKRKSSSKLKVYDYLQCYHPAITLTPIDNYRKTVPMQNFKGYGIELEINKDNDISRLNRDANEAYDTIKLINKYLKGHAYYSTDGSLTHGFEIVTQPHTEKAMRNIKWDKLLPSLKKAGFTDNSVYAGYHIHISRTLFGDTEQEIEDNIAKLIYFFEKNKKDLIKISRRETTRWCPFYTDVNLTECDTYRSLGVPKCSKTLAQDVVKGDKFTRMRGAINLGNQSSSTVEIRLFRNTLNYTEFMSSFDFVTTLMHNIKNITWSSINNNKKWLKGLSTMSREYLKSKNTFMEAI